MKQHVSIKSDGTPEGTSVHVDGVELKSCTHVHVDVKAAGSLALVTLTMVADEIEYDGESQVHVERLESRSVE